MSAYRPSPDLPPRFPTEDTQALYQAMVGPTSGGNAERLAPDILANLNDLGWFLVPKDQVVTCTDRGPGAGNLLADLNRYEDERSAE